jgi:6-phosphogluconolactonase
MTTLRFEGNGPLKDRQEAAHAHAALYHSATSAYIVTDLGADKLRFIKDRKEQYSVDCNLGDGPRHLVSHGNGESRIDSCVYR